MTRNDNPLVVAMFLCIMKRNLASKDGQNINLGLMEGNGRLVDASSPFCGISKPVVVAMRMKD